MISLLQLLLLYKIKVDHKYILQTSHQIFSSVWCPVSEYLTQLLPETKNIFV